MHSPTLPGHLGFWGAMVDPPTRRKETLSFEIEHNRYAIQRTASGRAQGSTDHLWIIAIEKHMQKPEAAPRAVDVDLKGYSQLERSTVLREHLPTRGRSGLEIR